MGFLMNVGGYTFVCCTVYICYGFRSESSSSFSKEMKRFYQSVLRSTDVFIWKRVLSKKYWKIPEVTFVSNTSKRTIIRDPRKKRRQKVQRETVHVTQDNNNQVYPPPPPSASSYGEPMTFWQMMGHVRKGDGDGGVNVMR